MRQCAYRAYLGKVKIAGFDRLPWLIKDDDLPNWMGCRVAFKVLTTAALFEMKCTHLI